MKEPTIIETIIDFLNLTTGRRFRVTASHKRHINARLSEGFSLLEFRTVIIKMNRKWGNDPKMADYLRPSTLFGTKMDGYLNSPDVGEIEEPIMVSAANKKRAVGDSWFNKSKEAGDGTRAIPKGVKGILGIGRPESR